jgi:hypothetical protein
VFLDFESGKEAITMISRINEPAMKAMTSGFIDCTGVILIISFSDAILRTFLMKERSSGFFVQSRVVPENNGSV